MDNLKVIYQWVHSERMKSLFREVVTEFPALYPHTIYFRQVNLARSAMRAQPVVNRKFFRRATREYRIDYSRHQRIAAHTNFSDLPDGIVRGWMAHEAGHLVDYLDRPWLGMISFGVNYALNRIYLREAEKRADEIAVAHGFGQEILDTKQYLLNNGGLPQKYRRRLRRYYLSPDEIERLILAHDAGQRPEIIPVS
jgi:hypothetical protein